VAEFLTTRELADLLRIKERKVYELAASGDVPCVRVVGKLLFPRGEIDAWIASGRSGPRIDARPPPAIVAGSHDPLLEWALRESGSGLAAFFDGSLDGLGRLARRDAVASGLHLHEGGDQWNVASVEKALGARPVVLLEFARRGRGLVLPPGNPRGVRAVGDLRGLRFARRQPAAASQRLFEQLAAEAGLDPAALGGPEAPARTESDVALLVHDGKADAAFGLAAMAHQFRLDFVAVVEERFDLAVWRQAYFEPAFQAFAAFLRSAAFRRRAAEMPGYDVGGCGAVRYNAPGP
jgi:putative molybdopterin biosynthesis protein